MTRDLGLICREGHDRMRLSRKMARNLGLICTEWHDGVWNRVQISVNIIEGDACKPPKKQAFESRH